MPVLARLSDPDIEFVPRILDGGGATPLRPPDVSVSKLVGEPVPASSPDFRSEVEGVRRPWRRNGCAGAAVRPGHGPAHAPTEPEGLWCGLRVWRDMKTICVGHLSGARTKPSKPPGCRSRRCRRRTWSWSPELSTPSTGATGTAFWRCLTRSWRSNRGWSPWRAAITATRAFVAGGTTSSGLSRLHRSKSKNCATSET